MSAEDDEELVNYHDDRYYQNMLFSLSKGANTMPSYVNNEDERSPFKYLCSLKAMKALESKVRADGMVLDHNEDVKGNKRAVFLSHREAENMRFSSTAGMMKEIALLQTAVVPHSKVERQVEQQLLQPYRKNGPNRRRLFAHVNRIIRAKAEQNKLLPQGDAAAMAVPPPMNTSIPLTPLTVEERLNSARSRRAMLEQQEAHRHQRTVDETEQRALAALETHQSAESDRIKRWLGIIYTLVGIQYIRHNIEETRQLRHDDQRRWAAAMCIQRRWLTWHGVRSCNQVDTHTMSGVINRFKQSPQFVVEQRQFQRRQQATTTLLQFLRGTQIRGRARKLIRSVYSLQIRLRGLRQINRNRVALLTRVMEVSLMPLAAHVSVVAAHRGLDLKNLGAFELQQLKQHSALSRSYRFIAAMHSPGFHKLLRRQLPRIQDIHRDLIANNKLWTERSAIRDQLLKELLLEKRTKFLQDIMYVEPLSAVLPPFGLDEVGAFLRGGPDPVSLRLEDLSLRQQKWKEDLLKPMRPFQGDNPPRFMLLHSIKAKDVLKFYCDFLDACKAAAAAQAAASSIMHVSGMLRPAPIQTNNNKNIESWDMDIGMNPSSPSSRKSPTGGRKSSSVVSSARRATQRGGRLTSARHNQQQQHSGSISIASVDESSDAGSDLSSIASPPRSVRRSTIMKHNQRKVSTYQSNGSSKQ